MVTEMTLFSSSKDSIPLAVCTPLEGVKYHRIAMCSSPKPRSFQVAEKDGVLHEANSGLTIGPMIGSVPDVKSFQELS